MKGITIVLLCCHLLAPIVADGADFDYTRYAALLATRVKAGVSINGIATAAVDYSTLAKDAKLATSDYSLLLKELAIFDPGTLKSREERIAFWVNVYNIAAMKTIVDHYPVDSIRNKRINWRGFPWGRKAIRVGGKEYSLERIENEILLDGFKDLRIHFGINCASVSCADLLTVPYRAPGLYEQLEKQGRKLLANREKGMRIDRERNLVSLSQICKFDRKRFDAISGGALVFLRPFVPEGARDFISRGNPTLEYLDYDWKANDLKNVR